MAIDGKSAGETRTVGSKRNFAYRDGPDPDKHAVAFDAKIKRELDTGTSLDLESGQLKVRDYAAAWRKDLLHRDSTAERLERVFRLHVNPLPLGNLRMTLVRPSNMRSWVKDRSEVLALSTLTVVWGNVTSMFAAAVADRVIGISPCTGVTLPEIPHHKHYIPSGEQVHLLSENMPGRYSAVVYVAADTGFRAGEIMGLEENAIGFATSEIDVAQQLVCVTGQEPYLGPPKTAWGRPVHRSSWADIWAPAARTAGIPKGNRAAQPPPLLRHPAHP